MTWSWPSPLHNFTQGLITKVIYKSQWDSENYWDEADTSHIPTNLTNVTFTISGLKYAHALYDIRVFLRSAASTEPYKWSKPATYTLHTKASVPSRPPKTDIGSYRVQSHHLGGRNLIIYWQRIPQYLENGDNIHYKVIEVKENGIKRLVGIQYCLIKKLYYRAGKMSQTEISSAASLI
ncbi:hypothetical protein AAG570_010944 [Ranatra chinensis]|uniref:Uncharacterized protein n=1 Tax=Ranatra chinensis TaxID=642074 RepID=A0ABD0YJ60_9HEMI